MLVAPTPVAFENAATVSDWLTGSPSTVVTDCVLVTWRLASAPLALTVQISDTPRDVAARATRVHASPPPVTDRFWLFAPDVGPSDATNATSTAGPDVLNAGVVCAPVPSAETSAVRVGPLTVTVTLPVALPPRPSLIV